MKKLTENKHFVIQKIYYIFHTSNQIKGTVVVNRAHSPFKGTVNEKWKGV